MYPKLFGIEFLNMYGLCIGIGVVCCLLFLRYACKKLGVPKKFEDFVEINAIISIAIGVLSSMLFQSFYNYLDDPSKGFKFSTEGLTFIGGLIGGVITFLAIYFLYGRKKCGAYFMRILPIAACCILVAHGFGRIGCFCSGCCYGETFDEATRPFLTMNFPGTGWAYPTQLFEALFLFVLFGISAYLTVFKKYKYTMNIYLIAYGVFRFFNEYLRGDDRGSFIPGLTPSQFWSIVMVLLGVSFYFIMPYVVKKFRINYEPIIEEENIVLNECQENNE